MSLTLSHITIDSRNPYAQARWWCELAGFSPGEGIVVGLDECYVTTARGDTVLFIQVPDEKTVKNRMHFCLRPAGRSQDEEIERALSMGATVVRDLRDG
jgi:hypothetical protein